MTIKKNYIMFTRQKTEERLPKKNAAVIHYLCVSCQIKGRKEKKSTTLDEWQCCLSILGKISSKGPFPLKN